MKWNLRLAAANRGIWKASELQRMLAERQKAGFDLNRVYNCTSRYSSTATFISEYGFGTAANCGSTALTGDIL